MRTLIYKLKYDYPCFASEETGQRRKRYVWQVGGGRARTPAHVCLVSWPSLCLVTCSFVGSHSELVFIQIQGFLNHCCLTWYLVYCQNSPRFLQGRWYSGLSQRDYILGQIILTSLTSSFIGYREEILIPSSHLKQLAFCGSLYVLGINSPPQFPSS